ncbi:MAG: replication initiator protein A [SAR324 cluster bacterium]|nr:replication initiator protein A [SAR324 cluster bacterium]
MTSQLSFVDLDKNQSVELFKQLVKEKLEPEEYEGWLDLMEISVNEKEIIFSNFSHPLFRDDVKNNRALVFHDIAEICFPSVPKKMKFLLGRPKVRNSSSRTKEHRAAELPLKSIKFPPRPSDRHIEYPTDLTRITPFRPLNPTKKRVYISEFLYKNQYGYVSFTGIELGIDDEDVFMRLLDKASEQLKQNKKLITIRFKIREFLRSLNRHGGGNDIKWLNASLERLQSAQMTYKPSRYKLVGSFINSFKIDEKTGQYVIELNADIGKIYVIKAYTFIDFDQRLELKKPTTKRLHAYINGQRSKDKKLVYYTDADAKLILRIESNILGVRKILNRCHKELIDIGFLKSVDMQPVKKGVRGYHVEIEFDNAG